MILRTAMSSTDCASRLYRNWKNCKTMGIKWIWM